MKKTKNVQGSILIWSLTLGLMLTSVFFFFATRLSATIENQHKTMQHQNQKTYTESYAGFLESLPDHNLANLLTANLVEEDEHAEITGTLSKDTNRLTGFLDSGESVSIWTPLTPLTLEWNECEFEQAGDVMLAGNEEPFFSNGNCGAETIYKDSKLIDPESNTISLTAISGPLNYALYTNNGSQLKSDQWQLNLSAPISNNKTFEYKSTFKAE